MDWARKIGICVVMIIPAFVGAGAIWDIFHNWFAVFIWVAIMAFVAGNIAFGKWLSGKTEAA